MARPPVASFGTLGDGDRVYSVQEVAQKVWECCQRTVRDAIHDPNDPLPAFNVGRGKQRSDYRVLESELRAWMRRQQAKTQIESQKPFPTQSNSGKISGTCEADPDKVSFKARRAARLTAKGR